jgi:tripartite-type tricarboxylate transporter receptor subunit TctC
MSFDTITPVLPHIRAGKLRPLAVTTIKRSAALPDVPTLDEAGLKGFLGAVPVGNTSAQMGSQIRSDTERFAKLVKDAKVVIE